MNRVLSIKLVIWCAADGIRENEGLVVAEVELTSEDEAFEKPDFIGREVTGDVRYYNSQLMKHPYTVW